MGFFRADPKDSFRGASGLGFQGLAAYAGGGGIGV